MAIFKGTLESWVNTLPDKQISLAMWGMLSSTLDKMSSCMQTDAGLVIKAALGVLVKTGATGSLGTVGGKLFDIPASTDMPALVGTVTEDFFNVWAFFQDAAGVRTSVFGVEAATLAAVEFPAMEERKTLIGYIKVNPTTAVFIGGTTALDAADTNVSFASPTGAFDPAIRIKL